MAPTAKGTLLTAGDIAFFAKRAGFTGRDLEIAVAVALGESGGWTGAHNPIGRDDSYGLWQINMRGNLEQERLEQFKPLGVNRKEDLFKAWINAHAAAGVYSMSGNSFRPWTVFTNGTWLNHMTAARKGVRAEPTMENIAGIKRDLWREEDGYPVGEEPLTEVPWFLPQYNPNDPNSFTGIIGTLQGIANAISFLTNPKNWLRVAGFVGGGLLLLFGLIVVARETGVGEAAVNAIPAGRVIKKVVP